jgi:hypothetical protein
VAYLVASSLLLHSHQTAVDNDDEHHNLPNSTKLHILVASVKHNSALSSSSLDPQPAKQAGTG